MKFNRRTLAISAVALLLVGGGSAALLDQFGTVSGETDVQQSLTIDGNQYSSAVSYGFGGSQRAGTTHVSVHEVSNNAEVPVEFGFVTEQDDESTPGFEGDVEGIQTSYRRLGTHNLREFNNDNDPTTPDWYQDDRVTVSESFDQQDQQIVLTVDGAADTNFDRTGDDAVTFYFDENEGDAAEYQVQFNANGNQEWSYYEREGSASDDDGIHAGPNPLSELDGYTAVETNEGDEYVVRIDESRVDVDEFSYKAKIGNFNTDNGGNADFVYVGEFDYRQKFGQEEETRNGYYSSSDWESGFGAPVSQPETLQGGESADYAFVNEFHPALYPGRTYNVTTDVVTGSQVAS